MAGKAGRLAGARRLLLAGLLTAAVLKSAPAAAQILMLHQPPPAAALPYPGKPLKLSVQLAKTRSTSERIRALVVLDGRLIDLPLEEAFLDEQDRPTYSAEIPAPIRELSYQFVLYPSGGTPSVSRRYRLRRQCLIDTKASGKAIDPERPLAAQVQELYNQAAALEQDLLLYKRVEALLDELEGLMRN